jgi:hypothetical protein
MLAMEWTGTFEIPDSGVRVGGRLTIDAGDSVLTTFGELEGASGETAVDVFDDEDKVLPMVWCLTEEGERLTLLDLVSLGGSLSSFGQDLTTARQQWIVGSAIGALIEPVEPVTFSSISFGFTDLSTWLHSPRHSQELRLDDPKVDVTVAAPDIAEIALDRVTFTFGGQLGVRGGFDSVTVDYPARVTSTTTEEMEWHELVNTVVTPLEVMLWIATGRFSALEHPRVRLEGEHPQYFPLWVSPLEPRSFTRPEHRRPHQDLLYAAADMPGGLESGVARWFDIWDDISAAFGPVIARYRAPFAYANDRFHAAVAALESYSTWKHGKRAIPKTERNRRIEIVRNSLDTSSPELTDWVLNALDKAHYHTLRTRMHLLLDEAGPISEALVGDDVDEFITGVIKARDAYAHSVRIVGGIEGGAALHWAAQGLNWILRYHALCELGFEPEPAKERVLLNHTFQQEASRLKDELGLSQSS